MADAWLCLIDGHQVGPVPRARLLQLAQAGRLKGDDYVRPESQEHWSFARDIAGLIPDVLVTSDASERSPPKPRQTAAMPKARAMPATTPPVGRALPPPSRGIETATAPAPLFQVAVAEEGIGRRRFASKTSISLPLLVGGGVVASLLGIVLLLAVSGVFRPANKTLAVSEGQAIANEPTDFPETLDASDESNPLPAEGKAAIKQSQRDTERLLKSVKKWNDLSKLKELKLSPVKLQFTGVWLSLRETGEPIVDAETSGPAKYLVLRVQIENAVGAAPMNYGGWGNDAVLIDEKDHTIRPLPPGAGPLLGQQRLAAGAALVDTLVFPLTNLDFEKLRLVLPHDTVGIKDARSFGLDIPRHALGRGLENQLVARPGAVSPTTAARVVAPGPGGIIAEGVPATTAVTQTGDDPAMTEPAPAVTTTKPMVRKEDSDDFDGFLGKLKAKQDERDKMDAKK